MVVTCCDTVFFFFSAPVSPYEIVWNNHDAFIYSTCYILLAYEWQLHLLHVSVLTWHFDDPAAWQWTVDALPAPTGTTTSCDRCCASRSAGWSDLAPDPPPRRPWQPQVVVICWKIGGWKYVSMPKSLCFCTRSTNQYKWWRLVTPHSWKFISHTLSFASRINVLWTSVSCNMLVLDVQLDGVDGNG